MKKTISLILILSVATLAASALYAQENVGVTQISTYNNGWAAVNGVFVAGRYAYVAAGSTGLVVVRITDLGNPVQTGVYDTPGSANGVVVQGDYAYVADGAAGLVIVDISDPDSPTGVGQFDTPGTAWNCVVDLPYVYVADVAGGLRIIDVSVPDTPTEPGFWVAGDLAYGLTKRDNLIYLADRNDGLRIIDVTDPEVPEEVGFYDTPSKAYGVGLWGDRAFVADNSALRAIKIANPALPTYTSAVNPAGYEIQVWVDRAYAFLANGSSGFYIYDVANPAAMAQVGNYDTPGSVKRCYFVAPYLYVADNDNLGIYDCSEALDYDLADDTVWVPTEYKTIQAGIGAADLDDIVRIRRGRYRENIDFGGKDNLVCSNYYYTSVAADRANTIIDGGGIKYTVIFRNGETFVATLSGLTIRGAGGSLTGGIGNGSGISCKDAAPTIEKCIIRKNDGVNGGGIYLSGSAATITDCVIDSNTARSGAGIYCYNGSDAAISNTLIRRNTASQSGGGVYINASIPDFNSLTDINLNIAPNGSGIYALNSDFTADHILVTRNTGPGGFCVTGAGISLYGSDLLIDFCTIANNRGQYGKGLYVANGSDVTVINSILWNDIDQEVFFRPTGDWNTFNVAYSDLRCGVNIADMGNGDVTIGDGLLQINPAFVSSSNFHLRDTSACIGAAEEGADMGALPYEEALAGQLVADINQPPMLPLRVALSPVYPNPFNARLHISFLLPETAPVAIAAYDISGRLVAMLLSGQQPAGMSEVSWDASEMPAGVYLIKMETPGYSAVERALLLK